MSVARLASTALDCAEPLPLAQFWAALIGGEVVFTSDKFCAVRSDGGWVTAMKVESYQPPTWPDDAVPKQMHLDLATSDLDAAEAEALRLGARKAAEQPSPDLWRVFLDPAGHPFCFTTLIPS